MQTCSQLLVVPPLALSRLYVDIAHLVREFLAARNYHNTDDLSSRMWAEASVCLLLLALQKGDVELLLKLIAKHAELCLVIWAISKSSSS